MAIAPISFGVGPKSPSIIEQAFASVLATLAGELVSSPFRKAQEKRVEARQIRQEGREHTATIETEKRQLANQTSAIKSQLEEQRQFALRGPGYAELTDDLLQSFAGVKRSPNAFVDTDREGKRYIPTALAEEVQTGAVESPENAVGLMNRIATILKTKPIPQGTNVAAMTEIQKPLGEAVSAVNAETNAKLRAEAEESNRLARAAAREQKLATLLPQVTADDIAQLGSFYIEGEGPITDRDIQIMKAGNRLVEFKSDPDYKEVYERAQHIDEAAKSGKLKKLTLNGPALDEMIENLQKPLMANQRRNIALELDKMGLMMDANGKRITEPTKQTTFLEGNYELLQAVAVARLASDMDDVMASTHQLNAPTISDGTLAYLQLIFKARGAQNWKHPSGSVGVPPGITPPAGFINGKPRNVDVSGAVTSDLRPVASAAIPSGRGSVTVAAPTTGVEGRYYTEFYNRLYKASPANRGAVYDQLFQLVDSLGKQSGDAQWRNRALTDLMLARDEAKNK